MTPVKDLRLPTMARVAEAFEQFGDWAFPHDGHGEPSFAPRFIAGMIALVFVGFIIGFGMNPTRAQNTTHDNSRDIMELQFKVQAQATTNEAISRQLQRISDRMDAHDSKDQERDDKVNRMIWSGSGIMSCIAFLLMFPYLRATIFKREGRA